MLCSVFKSKGHVLFFVKQHVFVGGGGDMDELEETNNE